jgi:hypothetical protein
MHGDHALSTPFENWLWPHFETATISQRKGRDDGVRYSGGTTGITQGCQSAKSFDFLG